MTMFRLCTRVLSNHLRPLACIVLLPKLISAASYTFTTFDYPNGNFTMLQGINNANELVGQGPNFAGFIYSGGVFTTVNVLPPQGGNRNWVSGINNLGSYTADAENASSIYQGYVVIAGVQQSVTSGLPAGTQVVPTGINDNNRVVGWYANGPSTIGFVYDVASKTFTSLQTKDGTSQASGINNEGVIVGESGGSQSAYIYSDGALQYLKDPEAGLGTVFNAINNSDAVVGTYYTNGGDTFNGLLYQNGTWSTVDFPGADSTVASDINDAGVIVGSYYNGTWHGFIATPTPEPVSSLLTGGGLLCALGVSLFRRASNNTETKKLEVESDR